MSDTTRIAAIQLAAIVGDTRANMSACEALVDRAAREGARWIILPEFFTTGMAFEPALENLASATDGEAPQFLSAMAESHGAYVGGSFLCRDEDGHVRNAFMLFDERGSLVGRHDKDMPTMWESCFYTGGNDDGVIRLAGGDAAERPSRVGVAMCWELIRAQTAQRLRDRVDLVLAGSCWWSIPEWHPAAIMRRFEARNRRNATHAAPELARLVGAPIAHAAHCGNIDCRTPLLPVAYHGRAEGGTGVYAADGRPLAFRDAREGPGIAIADVALGRRAPVARIPDGYWLCARGPIPALAWSYQGKYGRRRYRRRNPRPATLVDATVTGKLADEGSRPGPTLRP